jgi:hypothetical protein
MAISATENAGIKIGTAAIVVAGSVLGIWKQTHADACATAQTTAMQYNPSTLSSTNIKWLRVPVGATRCFVQARVPKATTTIGTNPLVKVYGGWIANGNDATLPENVTAGEVRYMRLDSAAIGDTGTTIAWPSTSPSTSNTLNDSTWYYSTPPTQTGFDTLSAEFVCVMVTTAAGALTASGAMPIDILFTN